MSELSASLCHLQSPQSVAFKFFSDSVKEIEKQISSPTGLKSFTDEQIDFIVLICDQFQKLVKLRGKNKLIDDLLSQTFPKLFKPVDESSTSACESARNETVKPISKGTGNQSQFQCAVCEEIIPILNDGVDYSIQLHLSSPNHLEIVSIQRKIKESAASMSRTVSSSSNSMIVSPQNGPSKVNSVPQNVPNASRSVVSNLKTGQPSKQLPVLHPISKAEESFQRFEWIQSQRQNQYLLWHHDRYYCSLCDATLPTQHNFDAHVRTFAHKAQIRAKLKSTVTKGVGTSSMVNLSHNDYQTGKSRVSTFCRSTSVSSLKEQTSNVSLDFLCTRNGKLCCSLCNVLVPGKAQQDSHFNGSFHKEQLKTMTEKPVTKSFNDSIFTRGGIGGKQYCILCDAVMPGKSQLTEHIRGKQHRQNTEKYRNQCLFY